MFENSLEDNFNYYEKVKRLISVKKTCGEMNAFVRTYGCQQNASDGEKFTGMLEHMGFKIVNNEEKADIIVINTCAIREHAENRIFGNIGALKNLKKVNPDLIIVVCGCMTEQSMEVNRIKNSYPFIDIVFGTHSIRKFPEILYNFIVNKKRIFIDSDCDESIFEGIPVKRAGNVKAFVPIMYGCNNFCSYCIVPYVRGRERSRKSQDILMEVEKLLQSGYKEILLLGQNVNSYGLNLDENINFAELLRRVDSFDGEYRIRFMTSHPKDATNELIDVIAESKHICHNIHLPVQSGNDRILKAMNRRYTRQKYLDIINYAKKKIKNLSLSSDIIVGFPGETYQEFQDTVSLIKEVNYTSLFTFIYSPRNGTPAASFLDPISRDDKVKWLTELLKVQEDISFEIYRSMNGKIYRVLVEGIAESSKRTLLSRTDNNLIIEIEGDSGLIGKFVNVEVIYASGRTLRGKII